MVEDSVPEVPTERATEQRIELLVSLKRFSQARLELAEGLRAYPENLRLLYLSAFVDWAEDRNDDARVTVGQLLGLNPEDYGGRTLLGHLQEESKQLAEAEKTWIGLLRDYPEEPDLYAHYADLMLRTFNVDKARQLTSHGLRLEPEHSHCLFVAATCDLIDGRFGGESENLMALVRHHPEHVRTGIALVLALEDRGETRAARRVSQELLRAQPENPQLLALAQHFGQQTHWSMLPLYPIQRWGWSAAIGLWAVIAFGLPLLAPGLPKGVTSTIVIVWLVYVVYSWVWPPIFRRWFK